jgi:hypothetical protein
MSSFDRVINSATATCVAEIVTLPICTLKTVYQNTNSKSIIETAKNIYVKTGIAGFYKASVPAIMSQMFSTSSKYTFYKKLEDANLPYTNKIVNGLLSGIMASIFTHPIDVVKIHWQMNDSLKQGIKENGLGVFYRGYSKTLSKVSMGSALFFPLTDHFKQTTDNIMLASLYAGFVSTLIIHPLDYLKTRHIYNQPLFQGFNPMFYYKGLTLNMMRILPHFVIVMTGIDVMNKYVNILDED